MNLNYYINYMIKKHRGQTRKQGTPYYFHPLAVRNILADKGFSKEIQIAGLLHDVVEDTNTTNKEIEKISNASIAHIVKLVTKEEGYLQEEYIRRIKEHDGARAVKSADRLHNLSEAHLAPIDFQKHYIQEMEMWYLDMAKDTVFETEINNAYTRLKEAVKQKEQRKEFCLEEER